MKIFTDLRMTMILLVAAALYAWPVRANEVIVAPTKSISLETSKGVLIRLSRPASTVFIADPTIADVQVKSPRLIYVLAKKPGETTLFAADDRDRVLANRRITVNHNLSQLKREFKALAPDSDVRVATIGSRLVLNGTVRNPREAEELRSFAAGLVKNEKKDLVVNLAVAAPSQVHLRVRVAEVSRNVLKQFGINWDSFFRGGNFLFGFFQGRPFLNTARNLITPSGEATSVFAGFNNGRQDINALIDALDDNGLITLLAEPNLTAISGKSAKFLAGGEFPIIVPQDANRVTIEFKQFGVSLGFKPTVLSNNRISLEVSPEVSELSAAGAVQFNGFSIPSLTTRRAETTVELGNGQSFAIGGLLQNNIRNTVDKYPGLGEVPVLGTLFRSSRFQRNETELVIIVTPYVVRPVSSGRLATPNDGLVPPTDMDRILHGRLYRPTARRETPAPVVGDRAETTQPIGFILE